MAVLSLCLLFTGPAHVVLHGLEGGCGHQQGAHSDHAHAHAHAHAHCAGFAGSCSEFEAEALALAPAPNHSEEDCVHCMQSGGESSSFSISSAAIPGEARAFLALDHQVHREAPYSSSSPRGPPVSA
ncbi:MAG: hypothetical protein MK297_03475 [Planctomycetes bacterium]|nr:hypothetical protein [Planctomycetota bacterium]